jgi:protein-S-isoprenylcysteine O-methyltransferase Ste14
VVLPGTVTVVVPWLILRNEAPFASGSIRVLLCAVGASILVAGFGLWLWTVRLFASIGDGTLAPWDPTRNLVAVGPYRHVRNPMISGVFGILLGEALVFASVGLLIWAAAFLLINTVYFAIVEEPGLEARFGEPYREYKRSTPRWLPRR